MAQSRKRLFIVLVRRDICPHPELVNNIAKLVCKVLPFSFVASEPYRPRETVQEICHYNTKILEDMGRPRTMPDMSKDTTCGKRAYREIPQSIINYELRRSFNNQCGLVFSMIQRAV